jgi:hypothetical protein
MPLRCHGQNATLESAWWSFRHDADAEYAPAFVQQTRGIIPPFRKLKV